MPYTIINLLPGDMAIPGLSIPKGGRKTVDVLTPEMERARDSGRIMVSPDNKGAKNTLLTVSGEVPASQTLVDVGSSYSQDTINQNFAAIGYEIDRMLSNDQTKLQKGVWWNSAARVFAWDGKSDRFMRYGKTVAKSSTFSFARNSIAYKRTALNTWQQVAANVLRVEPNGVRIEPAATNYLRYSSNLLFGNPWFTYNGGTVEATAIAAPFTGNFVRVRTNGAGTSLQLFSQSVTGFTVVGNWYTGSIWVMGEGADIGKLVRFETSRHSGGSYVGEVIDVMLTATPQRVHSTFQAITGNTAMRIAIISGANVGTAAATVLIANPQLEDGKIATSPIETGATSAQRAADAPTINAPEAGTATVEFAEDLRPILSTATINGLTFARHAGANSDAIQFKYPNSGVVRFKVAPGYRPSFDDSAKERSELLTGVRFAKSVPIWNSYSVKIDDGFQSSTNPAHWFIIGQWHGANDADGRSPYIAVKLIGNDLVIDRRYFNGTGQSGAIPVYTWANVPRNQWINIVMSHQVDQTTGFFNVWVNGKQVVNYSGVHGFYDDTQAGYWKHGIYRNADSYEAAVEIQNHEEGTADLSARILNPLPIDRGTQNLNLTFGQQTIDPTLLLRPLVKSIYY